MKNYKIFLQFAGFFLALLVLSGLQIAFFNPFLQVNLIMILTLFLIIKKYNYPALFSAWLGGLLADTAHFSAFGTTSLVLVTVTVILIYIRKKVFFTQKTETVVIMSALAVVLARFTEFAARNTLVLSGRGDFENFQFFFLNFGFVLELILTAAILLLVAPKTLNQLNKINARLI